MSDNVKPFPSKRIRRIPVNLPFERMPQCEHDTGVGEPAGHCRQCANERVLEKIRGVPAIPCTPEIENDPRNPNVKPPTEAGG
jgi:hypothetical protein